ncbi:hypothetical protein D3C78_1555040 [compost metagenome]
MKKVLAAIAIAPIINGTMICQRRSRIRSELVPITSIPSRVATLGSAVSMPMVVMSVTPAVLIKVGIQNPIA